MPQRKSSLKRLRADKKRRLRNLKIKSGLKKSIKKFQALLAANNHKEAEVAFKETISKLDKAALKGIIHTNTASRKKSQLARRLSACLAEAKPDREQFQT